MNVSSIPGVVPVDSAHRQQRRPAAGEVEAARGSEQATGHDAARGRAAQGARALTEADLRQVQALRATDAKVRAHEQAHVAAGGALVRGGARYEYTRGPDGRQYAVAGEVSIDSAEVPGDPQRTLERAEQVRRAALAPAEPSAQDRAVAAAASATIAEARAELAAEATDERRKAVSGDGSDGVAGERAPSASRTAGEEGGATSASQSARDGRPAPTQGAAALEAYARADAAGRGGDAASRVFERLV